MDKNYEILTRHETDNMDDFCNHIAPISFTLATSLKNFFSGRSTNELLASIKMKSMQLKAEERNQLIRLTLELAKLEQLSDERFRLLMIAISGCDF